MFTKYKRTPLYETFIRLDELLTKYDNDTHTLQDIREIVDIYVKNIASDVWITNSIMGDQEGEATFHSVEGERLMYQRLKQWLDEAR